MKKAILFLALWGLTGGCAYEGRALNDYIEQPQTIIQDPHFESYKEKRDALESQYLRKEIPYADYVQKTKELDDSYAKQVQKRDAIITSGE